MVIIFFMLFLVILFLMLRNFVLQILEDFNFLFQNSSEKFLKIWPKIKENIIQVSEDLGVGNSLAPFMTWAEEIRAFIALLILLPAKPGKTIKGKLSVENTEGSVQSLILFKEEVSIQ